MSESLDRGQLKHCMVSMPFVIAIVERRLDHKTFEMYPELRACEFLD